MTVEELISELEKLDKDMQVVFKLGFYEYPIVDVGVNEITTDSEPEDAVILS